MTELLVNWAWITMGRIKLKSLALAFFAACLVSCSVVWAAPRHIWDHPIIHWINTRVLELEHALGLSDYETGKHVIFRPDFTESVLKERYELRVGQ